MVKICAEEIDSIGKSVKKRPLGKHYVDGRVDLKERTYKDVGWSLVIQSRDQ
jgi:hypothetical protein